MLSQFGSVSRPPLLEPKISYLSPVKGSVQTSLNLTSLKVLDAMSLSSHIKLLELKLLIVSFSGVENG